MFLRCENLILNQIAAETGFEPMSQSRDCMLTVADTSVHKTESSLAPLRYLFCRVFQVAQLSRIQNQIGLKQSPCIFLTTFFGLRKYLKVPTIFDDAVILQGKNVKRSRKI